MSQREKSSCNGMNKWGGIFHKTTHPHTADESQGWEETNIADTLNVFDFTEMRTPVLIVEVSDE